MRRYSLEYSQHSLYGSGRAVEKSDIFLQIEKAVKSSDGYLICLVFSIEDVVTHLVISHLSGVLTIER